VNIPPVDKGNYCVYIHVCDIYCKVLASEAIENEKPPDQPSKLT
jgi:hypothetical protein